MQKHSPICCPRTTPTKGIISKLVLSSSPTLGEAILEFPKGKLNFNQCRAILHDPAVYPDPHIFKPERFLTTDGKKLNPDVKDPEATWGFGRRSCPGRKMANSEMYIVIAAILATLDISAAVDSTGKPIEPSGEYGSGMLRWG